MNIISIKMYLDFVFLKTITTRIILKNFQILVRLYVNYIQFVMLMCVFDIIDHPYYVAVQYHPEYLSRPMKSSPPYLGLLLASCGKLSSFLSRGCRMSPRVNYSSPDVSTDEEEEELTQELVSININATSENTEASAKAGAEPQ